MDGIGFPVTLLIPFLAGMTKIPHSAIRNPMSTPLPPAPFNVKDSLFAGLAVILLKLDAAVTDVAGVATTGVLTKAAHGFRDGQQLRYVSGTGGSGLTAGDVVFVRDAEGQAHPPIRLTQMIWVLCEISSRSRLRSGGSVAVMSWHSPRLIFNKWRLDGH